MSKQSSPALILWFILLGASVGCSDSEELRADSAIADLPRHDTGVSQDRPRRDTAAVPSLEITPVTMKSYVGGTALFLVRVPQALASIEITTVPPSPFEVWPQNFVGPGVLELVLQPADKHLGQSFRAELTIIAGERLTGAAQVETIDWTPPAPADALRDLFIAHLETRKPELGITAATSWQWWGNSAGKPLMDRHLYLSDSWEMEIGASKLIPPKDEVDVYLRRRGELTPSWAAHINSLSDDPDIEEVAPPEAIIR